MSGVPRNYRQSWRYRGVWREKKVAPGTWVGRFKAVKNRSGSPHGGLHKGERVVWRINGYQTATKVGGRTYLTDFRFKKHLVKYPR